MKTASSAPWIKSGFTAGKDWRPDPA